MTRGQFAERFGQPIVRVDARDLAVLDERGDDRPVVAAFIGASKQSIFPIEREGPSQRVSAYRIA